MTKAIVIKIFEVSKSYRVAPSRKGAHRQLAIDKNETVITSSNDADIGYTRANYLIGRVGVFSCL